MKLILTAALGAVLTAAPAQAEDQMFSYNVALSKTDAYSSGGEPLEGWCTLIRQDRANWHRFKKRDADDEADPFFDSPERRAMIDGKCAVNANQFSDPGAQIRSGNREFHLTVRVFGTGGQVTKITFGDAF